jgi:hypothetical protein
MFGLHYFGQSYRLPLFLLGLRQFHLSVKIVDHVASSREVRFVILQGMV